MKHIAVIMAGGAGERFWPLSRLNYPKQLVKIAGNKSMLSMVVERICPFIACEDIYVISNTTLKPAIEAELPMLPAGNVVAEPSGRNTSACLALACSLSRARYSDDVTMLVLTADSYISDHEAFAADCAKAVTLAEETDSLVLFGVRPNRPETGYGYIEVGPSLGDPTGFQVASFREKPNFETAMTYMQSRRYLWNAGQFAWKVSTLEHAFQTVFWECAAQLEPMEQAFIENDRTALTKAFEKIPKLSIDYGVLEKYQEVAVIEASFPWDDIGTWDSIARLLPADGDGNVILGNGLALNSNGTVIYSVEGEHRQPNTRQLVVTYNVKDMVVVNTDDAVFVFPKESAQEVKFAVSEIRKAGKEHYL